MAKLPALEAFQLHFPEKAVEYCHKLWDQNEFSFKITRKRSTKFGDYRYNPLDKSHSITVNHDLNPFAFTITYIHEVAHYFTMRNHGRDVAPHGIEWKNQFQLLMLPLLNNEIFPEAILMPLTKHMRNPKASSAADIVLNKAIGLFDQKEHVADGLIHLSELDHGECFFLSDRKFEKLESRRTRVLCKEVTSGKRYLISQVAKVKMV